MANLTEFKNMSLHITMVLCTIIFAMRILQYGLIIYEIITNLLFIRIIKYYAMTSISLQTPLYEDILLRKKILILNVYLVFIAYCTLFL